MAIRYEYITYTNASDWGLKLVNVGACVPIPKKTTTAEN